MLYLLLIKQFIRSRIALAGLCFIVLAGISGIFIGKSFINKQQQNIAIAKASQQQHIKRLVEFEKNDLGLLLYYIRFGYVNKTNPLNGLSIGQRDINLGIQQVTIRNLEEKKYDTDLNNPFSLMLGNFDFGFVLIYLFPLLIISICYNALSEEKEDGTWAMLNVQSRPAIKIIIQKVLVRYVFVVLTFLLLNIVAACLIKVPINTAYLATIAIGLCYISFWFALCSWIISLQKDSNTNAIALLSIWMFLVIMLPSIINSFIITKYPVPEALHTAVANREGYHAKWDEPKEQTMQKFYEHYPQFKKYQLPKKEFSWLWYYAMQQMGDDDAKQYSTAMRQKLLQREHISHTIGYLIPSLHTQLQLNSITQSGLKNQIEFLDSVTAFHERKRLYFYPKIFEGYPPTNENWAQHNTEFFNSTSHINPLKILLPYLVAISVLLLLTYQNIRLKKQRQSDN